MTKINNKLEQEIEGILQECSSEDWDGYGAKPIDIKSVEYVRQFLAQLPSEISYPELVPEPTGDMTMVWRKNGYHVIVGIDSVKLISWGGTSPKWHIYGEDKFENKIPKSILKLLFEMEDHKCIQI